MNIVVIIIILLVLSSISGGGYYYYTKYYNTTPTPTPTPTVTSTTPAPTVTSTTPAPTVTSTTPAPTVTSTTPAPTVAVTSTTPAPTLSPAKTFIVEGQAVQCNNAIGSMFRYSDGKLVPYNSEANAGSWDAQWRHATIIDCKSGAPGGKAYEIGTAVADRVPAATNGDTVQEGSSVVCGDSSIPGAVYRYTGGVYRHYPGIDFANSWDRAWSNNISVPKCSTFGDAMPMNPAI